MSLLEKLHLKHEAPAPIKSVNEFGAEAKEVTINTDLAQKAGAEVVSQVTELPSLEVVEGEVAKLARTEADELGELETHVKEDVAAFDAGTEPDTSNVETAA